jgi:GNAT superfamily N-acetyltransferase
MSDQNQRKPQPVRVVRKDNRIVALCAKEEAGQMGVPHIEFQWAENLIVPMAGIGGVGTHERFRKQGIARRMMTEAVAYSKAGNYACGGVSTSTGNVSRRLYARAGYEYVFQMDAFTRAPRESNRRPPAGVNIRGYRGNDVHEILAFRQKVYKDCFGFRKPDADRWLHAHQPALDKDPESVLLAIRDDAIIGYATYHEHWSGLRCELCVPEMPRRTGLGVALVRGLEARLAAGKQPESKFSLCAGESFVRDLLQSEGYSSTPTRVFQVNILNLGALLGLLLPILSDRIRKSEAPDWSGTLEFRMTGSSGFARIGSSPLQARVALSADRPTITRILCGALSAWEAYLRGWLDVTPRLDDRTAKVLRAALPGVPQCHPADEWW